MNGDGTGSDPRSGDASSAGGSGPEIGGASAGSGPSSAERDTSEVAASESATTGRSGSSAETDEGDGTVDADTAGAVSDPAERNEGSVNSVENTRDSGNSSDFDQFRDELDDVERRIAGEIDPGMRAMVVAGAVFVLLLSLVLPHAGGARGFDVLLGTEISRTEHIGLPSKIFVWFTVIFAIGFSLLALMTRRWVLAWIAVSGTAIASVFGVLSIWHRQTPGLGNYQGAGPGIGLIIGAIAAIVLAFHWVRVVWSRTTLQLAAEEQRRIAAAAAEERDRRRLTGDN